MICHKTNTVQSVQYIKMTKIIVFSSAFLVEITFVKVYCTAHFSFSWWSKTEHIAYMHMYSLSLCYFSPFFTAAATF